MARGELLRLSICLRGDITSFSRATAPLMLPQLRNTNLPSTSQRTVCHLLARNCINELSHLAFSFMEPQVCGPILTSIVPTPYYRIFPKPKQRAAIAHGCSKRCSTSKIQLLA